MSTDSTRATSVGSELQPCLERRARLCIQPAQCLFALLARILSAKASQARLHQPPGVRVMRFVLWVLAEAGAELHQDQGHALCFE